MKLIELLNLGINLEKITNYNEQKIYKNNKLVEILIHFDLIKEKQNCIYCDRNRVSINNYRERKIHPILFNDILIKIKFKTYRYLCYYCKRKYMKNLDFIEKRHRICNSIKDKVFRYIKDCFNFKQIAKQLNITCQSVYNIFKTYKPKKVKLDTVLSIDEFKYKNKDNKFATMILNYNTNQIYDILRDRKSITIKKFLENIDIKEREKVNFITIDLYKPFKNLIIKYFPNAKIIVDKFHYKRLLNLTIRNYFISIIKNNFNYAKLKKYIKLLLTPYHNINGKMYSIFDKKIINKKELLKKLLKIDNNFSKIYNLYSHFLYFFKYSKNKKIIKNTLIKRFVKNFLIRISGIINENTIIKKLYNTFLYWKKEIEYSLIYKYTNSKIEGFNNKIKTIFKNSYGFSNFNTLKNKILLSF